MSSILFNRIMVFSEDSGGPETGDEVGAVFPPFTTTERDAIVTPKLGAGIYNSTQDDMNFFFNNKWNTYATRPLQENVPTTPFDVISEDILLVDPSAFDIVINLPPSADRFDNDIVRPITIRNIHNSNNFRVNIFPDGSEEINEVLTIQLKRGEAITLTPDGSNWWSISI